MAVWWLRPLWYARRSAWIDRALHGLMLFIVFNATIVYETGFIRWAGVALFVFLFTFRIASCCGREYSLPQHDAKARNVNDTRET